jgi:NADP-dependent aldehyde dehydrogenase
MNTTLRVLVEGEWRKSSSSRTFAASNPRTGAKLSDRFPISELSEVERAVSAAHEASRTMAGWGGERFAIFLERYAERLEARAEEICKVAELETSLPFPTRLMSVEMPRTTGQLRQAAAAARVCICFVVFGLFVCVRRVCEKILSNM